MPGPDGRFYQAHDPGNIILFIPAAIVAVVVGGDDVARNVPLAARLAASLTYSMIGAVFVTAIFAALRHRMSCRCAVAATVLAGCGTPIWVYTRNTMDVLPAALGTALLIGILLAHADRRMTSTRAAILAALAVALTGWFRVSVLPFVAASAIVALVLNDRAHWLRIGIRFGITLGISFVPVLIYNFMRSGNPLVLGTMHPRFAEQNGFSGDFATGLYGLFVSPNHGLIFFAPWLILGVTPAGFGTLSMRARIVILAMLIGAFCYAVMIAGLKEWAKSEWGPRYLIPVLPALIVPASVALCRLWHSRWRLAVGALCAVSLAVTAPAAIVNYTYVIISYPGAIDPKADSPRQIIGTYHALWTGMRGEELAGPDAIRNDPERAAGLRFPDLWTVRLIERGGYLRGAGFAITTALLLGLLGAVRLIARQCARSPVTDCSPDGRSASGPLQI